MSAVWARLDAQGCIPQELRSYAAEGWVQLPAGLSMEDACTMMRVEDAWLPRPRVTAPVVKAVTGGWIIVIDGLPEGAVCDVHDRDLHEMLDTVMPEAGVIAFLLIDPGTYQLDITAPAPWIGLTQNVELE